MSCRKDLLRVLFQSNVERNEAATGKMAETSPKERKMVRVSLASRLGTFRANVPTRELHSMRSGRDCHPQLCDFKHNRFTSRHEMVDVPSRLPP